MLIQKIYKQLACNYKNLQKFSLNRITLQKEFSKNKAFNNNNNLALMNQSQTKVLNQHQQDRIKISASKIHHNQSLIIKTSLQEIFSNINLIFQISKHTRILPYYFNKKILDKFIIYFEQNNQYKQHIKQKKKKHRSQKRWHKIQQNYPTNSNQFKKAMFQNQPYLQCYIDYLNKVPQIQEETFKIKIDMNINNQIMRLMNMTNPEKWFFQTRRQGQRKFIYHHGPTNSGKTYHAINSLKNLSQNQKGIYMAPLRLLAWQIQQKLGKCNLITGQQKQYQNSNLTSCTIQTLNVKEEYDVAVIDQIQMIGDPERGWSWTKAVLGTKAKIIHLCGDQRGLGLIKKLTQMTGDILQQKSYSRRSKLQLIYKKFDYSNLQQGDCIISFSAQTLYVQRKMINKMKSLQNYNKELNQNRKNNLVQKIENQELILQQKDEQHKISQNNNYNKVKKHVKMKGYTAIIYGRLPPQSRKNQAKLFNQKTLPYLVATNAIGMGLNLNINRIIFMSLTKPDGNRNMIDIQDHQIRQIAGRAGRNSNHGYVQCFNKQILKRVKYALKDVNLSYDKTIAEIQEMPKQPSQENLITDQELNDDIIEDIQFNAGNSQQQNTNQPPKFLNRDLTQNEKKIKRAGLLVQFQQLQRIKIQLQRVVLRPVKLSQCLIMFLQLSKRDEQLYFIQHYYVILSYLDAIQQLKLQPSDQFIFSSIPLMVQKKKASGWIYNMASQFKNTGYVEISTQIKNNYHNNFRYFHYRIDIIKLQDYFNFLDCYLWLWSKFEIAFIQHQLARDIMDKICKRIDKILQKTPVN